MLEDIQFFLSKKFREVTIFRLNYPYIIIICVLVFYIKVINFRFTKILRLSFPNIVNCCIILMLKTALTKEFDKRQRISILNISLLLFFIALLYSSMIISCRCCLLSDPKTGNN